jgi:hypothetical protein
MLSASRNNSRLALKNANTHSQTPAHAHVYMWTQSHKCDNKHTNNQSQTGAQLAARLVANRTRNSCLFLLRVGGSRDQCIVMHTAAVEHVHSRPSTLFAIETRDALVRIVRAAFVHVHIDPFEVRACGHFDSPCAKTIYIYIRRI